MTKSPMLVKELLLAYYDTQCLYVVMDLVLADFLQDGPKTALQLAQLSGARDEKLSRVLRYLANRGLFDVLPDGRFCLNEHSSTLVSSSPDNINNFIRLHATYFYRSASRLAESVRTEESAFQLEFLENAGRYFSEDAAAKSIYHSAMRENTELYARLITEIYDFSPYKTIVDVGGGVGSLLARILETQQDSCGINYDLPHLQEESEHYFKERGVDRRAQYIGGDFNQWIPQGGDLYMMKAILHAYKDEAVNNLLDRCREVMRDGAKLLVIERIVSGSHDDGMGACRDDMTMLNVTSGRVRTLDEFRALFCEAGLVINKTYPVMDAVQLLEVGKGSC